MTLPLPGLVGERVGEHSRGCWRGPSTTLTSPATRATTSRGRGEGLEARKDKVGHQLFS